VREGDLMPIYDFKCKACSTVFDTLVLKKTPKCPKCASEDLERLLSLPVVRSEGTHKRTMAQAKKQEMRTSAEKEQAQRQYEQSHED
jgi:putative FmdB family regulatory protein